MEAIDIGSLIQRIPIFQEFTATQQNNMREITEIKSFKEGEMVFCVGDSSTDMLIVLEGILQIRSNTGSEIATVRKLGIVGEMGVLTDHPRSASVTAQTDTNTLSIPTEALQTLIDKDADMGLKIYRNVTHILSERLRDNNMLIEQQLFILEDLTGDSFSS